MTHGHSWYWWRSQKPCSVRAENCRRSSRDIDLLSNCGEYGSGNLFYFHKGTTRKLQEGQLDGKSNAIRCPSSTIDQLTLFLGKGVMTCNVSVREVRGNLCQGVALFRVEIRWDFVISRHSKLFSNFALVVSYCLLGVNKTAWNGRESPPFPGLAGRKPRRIASTNP